MNHHELIMQIKKSVVCTHRDLVQIILYFIDDVSFIFGEIVVSSDLKAAVKPAVILSTDHLITNSLPRFLFQAQQEVFRSIFFPEYYYHISTYVTEGHMLSYVPTSTRSGLDHTRVT